MCIQHIILNSDKQEFTLPIQYTIVIPVAL